jgi:hypothetical protein
MDPTKTVVLESAYEGQRRQIELTFEEWRDAKIDIAFRDRLFRASGVIEFNGENGSSIVKTSRPYTGVLADPTKFQAYFRSLLTTFANSYTFGWSPAVREIPTYDADYHQSNNYIQGDSREVAIKAVQAQIIAESAAPLKCLIAGCSNGELVRQCCAIGLDAYGFDVIPNIEDIAFVEIRDRIRYGPLTAIPYTPEDAFDTLVAVDVLEHIPERDLPRMIEQWMLLGVRRLVLLINLNQFWFPGHITLRPLSWWAEQWKTQFKLVRTVAQFSHLAAVYSNTGHYNQQWTVWERL